MKVHGTKNARAALLSIVVASIAALSSAQPVVDGVFDPTEWSGATVYQLKIDLPEGGTTKGELYITNDATDLYVGLRYERSTIDASTAVSIYLDSDHSGWTSDGDDIVQIGASAGSCPGQSTFYDAFAGSLPPCNPGNLCMLEDYWYQGGTTDGNGAVGRDGIWMTHEMRHPLASTDYHDIQLRSGDKMPFLLAVFLRAANGVMPVSIYPAPYPTAGWAIYRVQ